MPEPLTETVDLGPLTATYILKPKCPTCGLVVDPDHDTALCAAIAAL